MASGLGCTAAGVPGSGPPGAREHPHSMPAKASTSRSTNARTLGSRNAVFDIVQPDVVVDAMTRIDMPLYVVALIGVWKLLGIVALASPRFGRVSEWAYAGFFFDLTGAAVSHAAGGDTLASTITPLVFLLPLAASYAQGDAQRAGAGADLAAA